MSTVMTTTGCSASRGGDAMQMIRDGFGDFRRIQSSRTTTHYLTKSKLLTSPQSIAHRKLIRVIERVM